MPEGEGASGYPDGAALHIAHTFDDRYWAPAYATMRSICLSTRRRKDITFHLLHGTLEAGHKASLLRIEEEFGAKLEFCDVYQNALFKDLMANVSEDSRMPNICYARLLFAELIDPSVARLLYLDCDMVVRAPIERLIGTDLKGASIGAALDYLGPQIITQGRMIDRRGIFDTGMAYFNAGMILVDMHKWRAAGVVQRFRDFMARGRLKQTYFDQDFLNLTFDGDWLELDPRWNLLDPRQGQENLNPYILHFTGRSKPWKLFSKSAFPGTYRYIMTNDVYYRFLAERSPPYLRALILRAKRYNERTTRG